MISSSASMSSIASSTSAHMPSSPSASTHGQSASSNLISLSTTIQQFDAIRKWLVKHHKKACDSDPPSNKNLSQFLQQFIQFQEDNLGKNAAKPIPQITRLPVSPSSPLTCHRFAPVTLRYFWLVSSSSRSCSTLRPTERCATCLPSFSNTNISRKCKRMTLTSQPVDHSK